MLNLTVIISERYDNQLEKFVYERAILHLRHSLFSISKWEETWKKSFLKKDYRMTPEEMYDYICCMVVNQDEMYLVDKLSQENLLKINDYINDKATATVINSFRKENNRSSYLTTEVLYAKMVLYGVPFETQYWHLNRLLILLQVIDAKANPKKMTKREQAAYYRKLNEERHRKLGIE